MNSLRSKDTPAELPQTGVLHEYELRLNSCSKRLRDAQSLDRLFIRLRVIAFLIVIAAVFAWIGDAGISWYWTVPPLAVFLLLLRLHAPIIQRFRATTAAQQYYQRAIERVQGNWQTSGLDGAEFLRPDHPWAADLDIFGPASLFQKLNQCRTLPGRRLLAEWMTTVTDAETAMQRQRQAESLRDQLDLRESLAVIDDSADWSTAESSLTNWLAQPQQAFPRWTVYASVVTGILTLVVLVMVSCGYVSPTAILLMLLLQAPYVMLNRGRIQHVMAQVDAVDQALRQLSEVSRQFETFPFIEKSLQQMQIQLTADGAIASERVAQFSRQIQWLNNALRNQFFMPIAWATGMFVVLPARVERWKAQFGHQVPRWLAVVSHLEAVTSVSGFNYEQPHYCLPVVDESRRQFHARQLGHPLLPPDQCVRNDVSLTPEQPLMLISGSNMSGKSTLLRSVGTNIVLAFCGARVCAEALHTYPFQIATAMRVSDSLQEGRSLFFTVVQRLKAIVDLTTQGRPVLFLLDEILSGTNSHDRRRGAEAIIRTLVANGALGMVTTHDLALTRIVEEMNGKGVNKHFEDQVVDGRMMFDYQLRDGVVERSNAIELMRMMGLDI